jgi:hypothetical protein
MSTRDISNVAEKRVDTPVITGDERTTTAENSHIVRMAGDVGFYGEGRMRVELVLTHHFATISKILVHIVDAHAVRLSRDVYYHFRFAAIIAEHGPLFEDGWASVGGIGVEITPETHDADAAENAENVALVFVEFWWCFAAKHDEIFAKERLNSGQTQMRQTRATIEQSVNASKG